MPLTTLPEQRHTIGLRTLPKDHFRLEWNGLDGLEKLLKRAGDEFENIVVEEMTKYGMLVEEGTKALAPHDTGDMEDTISFDRAKKQGNAIVVEGGASSKYAVIRHEAPYSSGSRDKYDNGAKFPNYYINGRGAGTRGKASWRGQMPGRKYMVRAIQATEKDYEKMNARIIDRLLGD